MYAKWGSNPRLSRRSKRRTSRSSRPRTQQSSAQEGHYIFRVMNLPLHEMIKSFQDLEIPIVISAFSSPALFSVLIPFGLLESFVFSDAKARLFIIKLIRMSSANIIFLACLKFKASFCICLRIIDMVFSSSIINFILSINQLFLLRPDSFVKPDNLARIQGVRSSG